MTLSFEVSAPSGISMPRRVSTTIDVIDALLRLCFSTSEVQNPDKPAMMSFIVMT
jgi:hypothetical protein